MRLIINEIFALDEFDNQQLAKYIRCMFQAILPLDDNLALQVVDQALKVAREGSQVRSSSQSLADSLQEYALISTTDKEAIPSRRTRLGDRNDVQSRDRYPRKGRQGVVSQVGTQGAGSGSVSG